MPEIFTINVPFCDYIYPLVIYIAIVEKIISCYTPFMETYLMNSK